LRMERDGHDGRVRQRGIPMRTWAHVARSAMLGFQRHSVTNLAAGLTYYAVLALFPGLLALVALLGVFGDASTVDSLLALLRDLGQDDVADQLEDPIRQMVESQAAGLVLVLGVAGATWSASGYVNGFGQAINRVYDVGEGRPYWKLRPLQLAITAVLIALAGLVLTGLVISGPLARELGDRLGFGDTAVRVWEIAKYPVLLMIVVGIVALLYSLTPNVHRRIRPLSIGAVIAIGVWILASLGFGAYVTNFGSYNSTYGSLAGVIVFLLWLWLTNLALLFGAEVDAEVERVRQLEAGLPAERTLQLSLRDDRTLDGRAATLDALVEERRKMRRAALARQARAAADETAARAEQVETMRAAANVTTTPTATTAVPDPTLSTVKVLGQVAAVGVLAAVVSALAHVFGSSGRD
jgi:membrane protein